MNIRSFKVYFILFSSSSYFYLIEDYEIFVLSQRRKISSSGTAEETKQSKKTFFTYNGLLKVIFRSNSGTAHRFRKWATRIIYTTHLGTDEQRFDLALDIASVNASLVKQVFDTCVTKVPCVYLFCILRGLNHCSYQKFMLKEKDKHIETLNKQIELYQEREQEWNNREQEWNNREQELIKEKKKLLKIIDKLTSE